jgi:pimeloyl-ACP methyl ester carboxylesterase
VTRRIIYCHGLPGSPDELSAFETSTPPQHVHGLDRLSDRHGDYQERLLAAFDRLGVDEPVSIAGFSLGAMSALHIAAERARLVTKLILISPAAPLELGDFLPAMAGRPVFEAARAGDWPLRFFSAAQASMVAHAPRFVINTMFRTSPAADRALLFSKRFVDVVVSGLRACLGSQQEAYRRELRAYVQPWARVLDKVQCETEIWTGSGDDWAPIGMAEALNHRLGNRATLNVCPGLGHYSTLQAALSRLD